MRPLLERYPFGEVADRRGEQPVSEPKRTARKRPVVLAAHGPIVVDRKAGRRLVFREHFLPIEDAIHEIACNSRKVVFGVCALVTEARGRYKAALHRKGERVDIEGRGIGSQVGDVEVLRLNLEPEVKPTLQERVATQNIVPQAPVVEYSLDAKLGTSERQVLRYVSLALLGRRVEKVAMMIMTNEQRHLARLEISEEIFRADFNRDDVI